MKPRSFNPRRMQHKSTNWRSFHIVDHSWRLYNWWPWWRLAAEFSNCATSRLGLVSVLGVNVSSPSLVIASSSQTVWWPIAPSSHKDLQHYVNGRPVDSCKPSSLVRRSGGSKCIHACIIGFFSFCYWHTSPPDKGVARGDPRGSLLTHYQSWL